jgi:hypothetical protein
MTEHLLGKTVRQIRDKRNDPSYKALVEQYVSTLKPSATPEQSEVICPSSDSEAEARTVYTRNHISETEDEDCTDEGEVSRQPINSTPLIAETTARETSVRTRRPPGLIVTADTGLPTSREREADHGH